MIDRDAIHLILAELRFFASGWHSKAIGGYLNML